RWPRFNEANSDDAPVIFAELSILWARMRRLPATSTHLHPQAACQAWKHQKILSGTRSEQFALERESYRHAPSRCSNGFFRTILYGRGRFPERGSERENLFYRPPKCLRESSTKA